MKQHFKIFISTIRRIFSLQLDFGCFAAQAQLPACGSQFPTCVLLTPPLLSPAYGEFLNPLDHRKESHQMHSSLQWLQLVFILRCNPKVSREDLYFKVCISVKRTFSFMASYNTKVFILRQHLQGPKVLVILT